MIVDLRLKVCGLTSLADAEFADRCGADYLGFILHPPSPRGVTLAQFRAMQGRWSPGKKVAVCVIPSVADLRAYALAGADFFQIHFPPDTPLETLRDWSQAAGPDKLWLAPRLPPGFDVAPAWLPLAETFLLDAFHPERFGGTGETGDWQKFARHQRSHPQKTWILSGGLNPGNIQEALGRSGANFVDVNSGVESAPGVKDRAKLERLVAAIQRARG
ncbi:MAG: phosphoribosylanthranilate isomerase [Opitutaceae bacterium]|jgi:phosphoribosylanthranilate isomerase